MLTPLPIVTKVASYTATYSSLTNATAVTKWYRNGQFLHIDLQVKWSGAGGAGAFTVNLPGVEAGSPVMDTAAMVGGTTTTNQGSTKLSDAGNWFIQGSGWKYVWARFKTTTQVGFVVNEQEVTGNQFANGDSLNISIKVPIVGW